MDISGCALAHASLGCPEHPALASRILRGWLTLSGFTASLVFFRASDLATVKAYLVALVSGTTSAVPLTPLAYAVLALAAVVVLTRRDCIGWLSCAYVRLPSVGQAGVVTTCLLLFAAVGGSTASFIYFQF